MLVDANILIYATDSESPRHRAASQWLSDVLNGDRRVGLPWQSLGAFVRITTHPRITREPLSCDRAWSIAAGWLAAPVAWIPPATERTAQVFGDLLRQVPATGNLVPDAQLAALALEHGLTVCSVDTDFGRFPDLRWVDPLR